MNAEWAERYLTSSSCSILGAAVLECQQQCEYDLHRSIALVMCGEDPFEPSHAVLMWLCALKEVMEQAVGTSPICLEKRYVLIRCDFDDAMSIGVDVIQSDSRLVNYDGWALWERPPAPSGSWSGSSSSCLALGEMNPSRKEALLFIARYSAALVVVDKCIHGNALSVVHFGGGSSPAVCCWVRLCSG
jgi:hypothetical protein